MLRYILHEGIESPSVQDIFKNHRIGGVIYSKEELLDIQNKAIKDMLAS